MMTITAIVLSCTIHISVFQLSQYDDINPIQEIHEYSRDLLGPKCEDKPISYVVEYISID